jgi:hypothetical protein
MPMVFIFVFTIVMVALGFAALANRWHYNFKLWSEELRTQGGDKSLGASELRELIQETMLDVIAPVEERLDAIETHLRRLPEHSTGGDTSEP